MLDKEYYLRWYKDKTVDELKVILEHNLAAIYSQDEAGARMLLAESQACSELIKEKQAAVNYMQNEEISRMISLPIWETANDVRRRKAILNLPAATSYYGQLVAAVLDEEDGLTAEEIRKWSDKLTSMEDDEYQKLLDDLCKEEILFCIDEGKYSLLSLCTPELWRTNLMLWLEQHYEYMRADHFCLTFQQKDELKFFQHMILTQQPTTEVDWIVYTLPDHLKKKVPNNPQFYYGRAKEKLSKFVNDGVLSITPIPCSDLNYYYFTMLGERTGK